MRERAEEYPSLTAQDEQVQQTTTVGIPGRTNNARQTTQQ
jgi:hypothetical protein